MNDWININHRLPDKNYAVRVLAYGFPTCGTCGLHERIEFCRYEDHGFEFGEFDCGFQATHWVPLPKPPKTEGL